MSDEDYGYLARRLVTEQNCARTAKCPEAATAHQKLADAYIVRLQSMLVPTGGQRWTYSSSDQQSLHAPSAERGFSSYLDLRSADAYGRSPA